MSCERLLHCCSLDETSSHRARAHARCCGPVFAGVQCSGFRPVDFGTTQECSICPCVSLSICPCQCLLAYLLPCPSVSSYMCLFVRCSVHVAKSRCNASLNWTLLLASYSNTFDKTVGKQARNCRHGISLDKLAALLVIPSARKHLESG